MSKSTGEVVKTIVCNIATYYPHHLRHGVDQYGVHKSASDGFLNRVAPPPDFPDTGLQGELDDLSNAVCGNLFGLDIILTLYCS